MITSIDWKGLDETTKEYWELAHVVMVVEMWVLDSCCFDELCCMWYVVAFCEL